MSGARGFGSGKIVGAPTLPKRNAGGHACRIPVVRACRPEVSSPGARGELQEPRHSPRAGIMVGLPENVGAPTNSDLQSGESSGVVWSAGACSRFYGANRKCQVFVIAAFAQSQKRRQAAALQNVGAPTFPKWNADLANAHARRTPVAPVFRPEVFSRDGMVAPGTRILTPKRGELQIPESELPLGRSTPKVGISKNVGAPTFLELPRAVRP
jgi:hypothetical protein